MKQLPYLNLSVKNIKGEVWMPCVFIDTNGKEYDYSERYEVSNFGRVKTKERIHQIREKCKINVACKVLSQEKLPRTGYLRVHLMVNGASRHFLVHRLVMLCFSEKIPGKNKVNHKRGNKLDNRLHMLEWSTHSENIQHAFDTGLHRGYKGQESWSATIDNKTALKIFKAKGTQKSIGKRFGVSRGIVCSIKIGKSWNCVTGIPVKGKIA